MRLIGLLVVGLGCGCHTVEYEWLPESKHTEAVEGVAVSVIEWRF
jgi:hypothetical protein